MSPPITPNERNGFAVLNTMREKCMKRTFSAVPITTDAPDQTEPKRPGLCRRSGIACTSRTRSLNSCMNERCCVFVTTVSANRIAFSGIRVCGSHGTVTSDAFAVRRA